MPIRARYERNAIERPFLSPDIPASMAPESGFGALAKGAGAFIDVYQKSKDQEDLLWTDQQYAKFNVDWQTAQMDRTQTALSDPSNNPNFLQESAKDFSDRKSKFLDQIAQNRDLSPVVANRLNEKLNSLEQQQSLKTLELDTKRNELGTKDLLTQRLSLLANEVTSTPQLLETNDKLMMEAIAGSRKALGDGAVDFARMSKITLGNAHVRGMIKLNAKDTLEGLYAGDYDRLLDPKGKEQLIDLAIRQMDHDASQQEHKARMDEHQLNLTRDKNFATHQIEAAKGTLQLDTIEQERKAGTLSGEHFNFLYNTLQKQNAFVSDTDTVVKLRIGISNGTMGVQDILDNKDKIDDKQQIELVDKALAADRHSTILNRSDVKGQWDRIQSTLVGGQNKLAMLDTESAMRLADAHDEFNSRIVQQGPQKSEEIANEILKNYPRIMKVNVPALLSLPRSLYWYGPRAGTKEELSKRLANAYENAISDTSITTAQRAIELKRLKQYEDEIANMPNEEKKK